MNMPVRSVWITGASQGLGRALALYYARHGATVYASARSVTALADLTRLEGGERIIPIPLDITDQAAVNAAVSTWFAEHPPQLSILNAGTHISEQAIDFSSDTLRTLTELNLLGTAHCIEALLPPLLRSGGGQVAIVASLAGYRGLPDASAYGATKAALINMTESLHIDLKPKGIDIRLINPGFIDTPLTAKNRFPMPALISAEKAAHYIAQGLKRRCFEVRFPFRFAIVMALLRHLPHSVYIPLIRAVTGDPDARRQRPDH